MNMSAFGVGGVQQPPFQPLSVPDPAVVERLHLRLDTMLGGDLAILGQLLAVVQPVELDRRVAGLVVEALIVSIEANRHHVGPLLHQLFPLGEPAIGDPVLDHRITPLEDHLPEAGPAGDIEVGKLGAVGLNLLIDRVRAVEMTDARAGVHASDVLVGHRLKPVGRGVVRVPRVRHRRVAGHRDDQFIHER
jgi:hypothetical protein